MNRPIAAAAAASLRTRSHQRSFIPRIPFRWLATRARQPRVAHTSCCPLVRVCRPGQWPGTGLAQNERSKRHWLTLARTRVCATLVLPGGCSGCAGCARRKASAWAKSSGANERTPGGSVALRVAQRSRDHPEFALPDASRPKRYDGEN